MYRKPTFSGDFTNFKSFLPTGYKFGLVYTLLHCGFNITSSYEINGLNRGGSVTDGCSSGELA